MSTEGHARVAMEFVTLASERASERRQFPRVRTWCCLPRCRSAASPTLFSGGMRKVHLLAAKTELRAQRTSALLFRRAIVSVDRGCPAKARDGRCFERKWSVDFGQEPTEQLAANRPMSG